MVEHQTENLGSEVQILLLAVMLLYLVINTFKSLNPKNTSKFVIQPQAISNFILLNYYSTNTFCLILKITIILMFTLIFL